MADENAFKNAIESLQNFDLSDLDFENIGRWPLVARIAACIIVAAVVCGLGYYVLIAKSYVELNTKKTQLNELKTQYETATKNAANLQEYKKQMERIQHEFSVLISQLPNDTEVPGLLDDITDEGVGNGLEFSSIGLNPEINTDIYVELPIQINVRGGYHNIASFISGIASLPRIVTVHDFTIKPEKSNSTVLIMDLLAKTYRYNEESNQKDIDKAK